MGSVDRPRSAGHTERSSWAACVAHVLGFPAAAVPLDAEELSAWLAQRGLGIVPVSDAASFAWAGPWIARRPALDNGEPRGVVMFGVPSGAIWDPAGTAETVLDGAVLAPLDVGAWAPPALPDPGPRGLVEAIVLAPEAEAPVEHVSQALARAGRGLNGDRYAAGAGTFASGRPGSAITLVEAEVLEELAVDLGRAIDHRRNVVVRGAALNGLVGCRFRLGEAVCEGKRLCEPCRHLDRLNGEEVLRPLVHRGGLRADILESGTIRVGDPLIPLSDGMDKS